METKKYVAYAQLHMDATPEAVWHGLTDPEAISQYMMGAQVASDWKEGSSITWSGEFNGKAYADTGKVLQVEHGKLLRYSHSSGGSKSTGEEHVVNIELHARGKGTEVMLTQDNNATGEAQLQAEKNWEAMLQGLKKVVEA
ncbi:MAG: SRPBCC family protein [Flavobacteriales bacterium]